MNKLRKALNYYQDISGKRKYFPSNVLNWQLAGKFLGQVPRLIGEKNARRICEKRHRVTKEFLISEFSSFLQNYEFKSHNNTNSKIIWSLWLQGYDSAPELVKAILDNSKEYAEQEGFEFILLDEKSMFEYVDFPPYITDKIKNGILTHTAIADLLRVSLLAKYGGTWLDSTVFLNKNFDSSKFMKKFYTIKTGSIKDYSPNVSKHRWKTFVLSGNSEVFTFTRDFFFEYYKKFDLQIDYLLIDYIFDLGFKYSEIIRNQMLELEESNLNLFWLESHLGDEFNQKVWDNITDATKVFKTTYKLSEEIKSNKNNFYSKLIDRKL